MFRPHRYGRDGRGLDLLVALILWVGAGGCNLSNPGVNSPLGQLNFPTALVSSPSRPGVPSRFLYVANSDFDLRYNAGSVQAYDLDLLEAALPRGVRDVVVPPSQVLVTVHSATANPEVRLSAHAASMALSPAGDRLYLAVRSDANITYIDVDPETGSLDCGGDSAIGHRCTAEFRRGDEAVSSPRNIELPSDPTGLVAGSLRDFGLDSDADWVVMSHRRGQVSLFLEEGDGGPLLVHTLSGLSSGLVNVRFDSATERAWVLSTQEARVGRVGIAWDRGRLSTSYLFDAGALVMSGVDDGQDVRDVRFGTLPSGHPAAYLLSRRPEAVLMVDQELTDGASLHISGAAEVGFGPSRLAVGHFAEGAETRDLLFASCYDSRDVWIVDPRLAQVITIVRGLSGPFEMQVDEDRRRLYVADFRASVVRVVDLTPMFDCLQGMAEPGSESCEPVVLGTIGEPRPVGDLL